MKNNTSKKNEDILNTARELFWKYGFRRVSVEEICSEAGVSKMTFYRFFQNKIELAKSVFDREVKQGEKKLKNIMKEDTAPQEKIRKILLMKLEGTNNISQEFLKDFYNNPELGLKAYVEERTARAWRELIKDFRKAQEDGIFRRDMKMEFLIYASQKLGDAVNDEKLLQLYNSPQDLIMELANFFAYGFSPREQ